MRKFLPLHLRPQHSRRLRHSTAPSTYSPMRVVVVGVLVASWVLCLVGGARYLGGKERGGHSSLGLLLPWVVYRNHESSYYARCSFICFLLPHFGRSFLTQYRYSYSQHNSSSQISQGIRTNKHAIYIQCAQLVQGASSQCVIISLRQLIITKAKLHTTNSAQLRSLDHPPSFFQIVDRLGRPSSHPHIHRYIAIYIYVLLRSTTLRSLASQLLSNSKQLLTSSNIL